MDASSVEDVGGEEAVARGNGGQAEGHLLREKVHASGENPRKDTQEVTPRGEPREAQTGVRQRRRSRPQETANKQRKRGASGERKGVWVYVSQAQ